MPAVAYSGAEKDRMNHPRSSATGRGLMVSSSGISVSVIVNLEKRVVADADHDPLTVLKQAVDLVHLALEEANSNSAILGIAFGLPVPMTREGLVGGGTLLPEWAEIDPHGELTSLLSEWPLYVANEADLGALGEYTFGWGEAKRDLTYVKLGTGIGGGIVLGGRLQRGSGGPAAEIGHPEPRRESALRRRRMQAHSP